MAASTGTSEQSSGDCTSLEFQPTPEFQPPLEFQPTPEFQPSANEQSGPTILIISDDNKNDLVHGMLVGVMLGDSLGHAHEFRYQTDVYTGKVQYKPKHQSRWHDTKYAVVGQYTDDTKMTLALAQSLIRMKGYDRNDVILSY